MNALSLTLARLQQSRERDMWRYETAASRVAAFRAAAALTVNDIRFNLICAFNRVAGKGDPHLSHAADHQFGIGPADIVAHAVVRAFARAAWRDGSFERAAPSLQRMVDGARRAAVIQAKAMGLASPYEAVLDAQTRGMRLHHLDRWEKDLLPFCTAISRWVRAYYPDRNDHVFPAVDRARLSHGILVSMGVEPKTMLAGVADRSLCLGTHEDAMIAVARAPRSLEGDILDQVREAGRVLYRRNLPPLRGLGDLYAGAGMDEAMGSVAEHSFGRHPAFLFRLSAFVEGMPDGIRLARKIQEPETEGLRAPADETRSPLDLILRTRIERAMFDEGLKVRDVPARWRREYKGLTGIDADPEKAIMNDRQWFAGEFGVFPAMLFGQMAAAQLVRAACTDRKIYDAKMGGNAAPLIAWMKEKIYGRGAEKTAFELVEEASGHALDVTAYIKHIVDRYGGLRIPASAIDPS